MQSLTYGYDALGNRVEETWTESSTTTTTLLAYDSFNPAKAGSTGNSGSDVWAEEVGTSSAPTPAVMYMDGDGVDQEFGQIATSGTGTGFLIQDELGSVCDVEDTSGNLRNTMSYGAYGMLTLDKEYATVGTATTVTNPVTDAWGSHYGFTGQLADWQTEMYNDKHGSTVRYSSE